MVQPLTPTYSVCGCNSLIPPDCTRLSPSLEINYNTSLFEQAYSEAFNRSQTFSVCFSAFADSFMPFCDDTWNYKYNWLVQTCMTSGCATCQHHPRTCNQYVGAVTQNFPQPIEHTSLAVTVWYNNQVL